MISKEEVKTLKNQLGQELAQYLQKQTDVGTIIFVLEHLGTLANNFEYDFLLELSTHSHEKVRELSIKNLAKLQNKQLLAHFSHILQLENATSVRREIVSAIGRLHTAEIKPILTTILLDKDPKIVCQAIRGLLYFKTDATVAAQLQHLINHPNEIVRTVIYKEYFAQASRVKTEQPHPKSYDELKNIIIHSDVMQVFPHLPNESIHLTFTSPPYYNARDYSIYESYDAYLNFLSQVFKEVHRITKEGRFLVVNTSPIIIPRVSRAHSSKRYPIPFDLHPYLVANGWEFVDDIVWLKPEYSVKNRIGGFMQHRKPLSYKPNSVTEYLMVYRKQTSRLLDWNIKAYGDDICKESLVADGYENNNVWKIDPVFDKIHSAVFPAELCKRVIQYYSFKNDLVFDPFGGSGTVGRVAKRLDRYFITAEQEKIYFEYMKTRIKENKSDIFKPKFMQIEEFINQRINLVSQK
jgi:DNA modification methylase